MNSREDFGIAIYAYPYLIWLDRRLSEKEFEQRSKREFSPHTDSEIAPKLLFVGLRTWPQAHPGRDVRRIQLL